MSKIKNVNLEFSCPENRKTLDRTDKEYHCKNCSKQVIDFSNKTNEDLIRIISESSKSVCGIFKKSQLNQKVMKYAAATLIVIGASFATKAQDIDVIDMVGQIDIDKRYEAREEFLGLISETQAIPIGGYEKFYKTLYDSVQYPKGLTEKGKVFVQFKVDSLGQMSDFKIIKGYNELAEQAALKAISTINFPFKPGEQLGKPISSRLVFPIIFDL